MYKARLPRLACAFLLQLGLLGGATRAAGQSTINQFPLGSDVQPLEIAAGPDGNLWFTVFGNGSPGTSKVGRITPAGVVTELVLADTSRPVGIVAGPDGGVWFTESGAAALESDPPGVGSIGRIDPATFPAPGSVTHFTAGIAFGSYPFGICVGPDGALWFTERNNHAVARITTAGAVTQYPIFSPSCSLPAARSATPLGIAVGPDGNFWVTDRGAPSSIIVMSMAGAVVKRIDIPTANGNPSGITAGPDGRMWFVELDGAKVGVLATTATCTADVTEYATPASKPYRIVNGPDGALWFTENGGGPAGRIARITTTGTITEYTTTGLSGPYGMCVGPDSAMWFTEKDPVAKIGQLILDCVLAGTCTASSRFYPVTPCRRIDTRLPANAPALAAEEQRTFVLTGAPCSIPAGAKSVSVNMTVTGAAAGGDLKAFATGTVVPNTTVINFSAGQTRANNGVVALAADGSGRIEVKNDAAGTVHVIIDVNGYFQ